VSVPPDDTEPANDDERAVAGQLANETAGGRWDRDAVARVRALLRGWPATNASKVLRLAGFARPLASKLAFLFNAPEAVYDERVGRRTLLTFGFVKIGAADWELTPETRANLALSFHPRLSAPLAPDLADGPAKGDYQRSEALGPLRFASGAVASALRFSLAFRGHAIAVTTSEDLLRDDGAFADRIDLALSNVPAAHVRLIDELVIDPGEHPNRRVAASTAPDGARVHMFLSGAGRDVSQSDLDETTMHEFGHVVSLRQADGFWERWNAARIADRIGVSRYGLTNLHEDFAEAYVLYLGGGARDAAVRARHPNRFAILDALM
jgi:hypothetical protein